MEARELGQDTEVALPGEERIDDRLIATMVSEGGSAPDVEAERWKEQQQRHNFMRSLETAHAAN